MKFTELDQLCVNALRVFSIEMIGKANSGHPGLPLGAAPMAYALWAGHLKYSPKNPDWFDRDRFVLSAGHGSALLYSLLYFYGAGLTTSDLENFRQLDSLTPGHPERGHTAGVETTTGPLGQGFANAVGMALAEKKLSGLLNDPENKIIDHYTYALVGDGDLMEGISYEAASLAGHLKLGKLICLYDSNSITIEGCTDLTFTEDIKKRFQAQGWQTLEVADGNNLELIDKAISKAKRETQKPSLIIVKTHIGFASPKQDTCGVHGEPLKKDEVALTRQKLGWPQIPPFTAPPEVQEHFTTLAAKGERARNKWLKLAAAHQSACPQKAALLQTFLDGNLPDDLLSPETAGFDKPAATREASHKAINQLAAKLPNFTGGAADLAPSTKTDFTAEPERTLHFGIREHAMGAIVNGLVLHGGLRAFGSTFLVFSDYMRPSIRLAAFMGIPSIFVFTHDSIGLGEDGPTHQPVEHLMSLRLIPGLTVLRPADAYETFYAWEMALRLNKPVCLALSRQKLPVLSAYAERIKAGVKRGAYALEDGGPSPAVEFIATGSEVSLVLEAAKILKARGIAARVVSMPSAEIFNAQAESYRNSVLKPGTAKLAVEAGRTQGWKDMACGAHAMGVETFGKSAPSEKAYAAFGLTPENIAREAEKLLKN
ncbi:MAG: transketolase [Elusimicrobia bacterium GWC2_51_8]|nr:MAG: transketolase [Elusimicrobia bacterium GWA2_51_34]OGR59543.1 MAG: transketolase [Elusimicrobia bacterium GWC2_51_8]OGR87036.1 MAG: transketolase [Elusimicrobia bacterium GWF2_52_66]HCE98965.1 transketolase [Elusimicrobiota bacterium]